MRVWFGVFRLYAHESSDVEGIVDSYVGVRKRKSDVRLCERAGEHVCVSVVLVGWSVRLLYMFIDIFTQCFCFFF